MSEVLFYHLENRQLDDTLPVLVNMAHSRGWTSAIRVESPARAKAVDRLLWDFDDQSFLPHGLDSEAHAERQPVLITLEEIPANHAGMLFIVGGAASPTWEAATTRQLDRVAVIFDGHDPQAVQNARDAWRGARDNGHTVTYWKENAAGQWEKHT